ncbi:hypothetical protein BDZ91DRAFT_828696 [Kalaharituber pfeilii]|nr:hypothetical protein BDZ91DRAFT_828696 [Kalaharituber pfeilii]
MAENILNPDSLHSPEETPTQEDLLFINDKPLTDEDDTPLRIPSSTTIRKRMRNAFSESPEPENKPPSPKRRRTQTKDTTSQQEENTEGTIDEEHYIEPDKNANPYIKNPRAFDIKLDRQVYHLNFTAARNVADTWCYVQKIGNHEYHKKPEKDKSAIAAAVHSSYLLTTFRAAASWRMSAATKFHVQNILHTVPHNIHVHQNANIGALGKTQIMANPSTEWRNSRQEQLIEEGKQNPNENRQLLTKKASINGYNKYYQTSGPQNLSRTLMQNYIRMKMRVHDSRREENDNDKMYDDTENFDNEIINNSVNMNDNKCQ